MRDVLPQCHEVAACQHRVLARGAELRHVKYFGWIGVEVLRIRVLDHHCPFFRQRVQGVDPVLHLCVEQLAFVLIQIVRF